MTEFKTKHFGDCLHKIRLQHSLTQKSAALLAGMDQSYLAGLETGRRSLPRERQLARLIKALQTTRIEEQELREAHAFSKLAEMVDRSNPERGMSMAALVYHLRGLSLDDVKLIEGMALRLNNQAFNPPTQGIHMT